MQRIMKVLSDLEECGLTLNEQRPFYFYQEHFHNLL